MRAESEHQGVLKKGGLLGEGEKSTRSQKTDFLLSGLWHPSGLTAHAGPALCLQREFWAAGSAAWCLPGSAGGGAPPHGSRDPAWASVQCGLPSPAPTLLASGEPHNWGSQE